ncbi:MAG: SH3 domain-containing protein [Anaerolineae bacterium]|jgi:hypothetical protein|nr:SH3 domain-containing protein [Anaerolineae bacterium]
MTDLKLTPTLDGLRVREKPVDGKPIGQLKLDEPVTALEPADAARAKVGVAGQWIHIRRADGTVGYVSGQFVRAVEPESPPATAAAMAFAAAPVKTGQTMAGFYCRPTSDGIRLRKLPVDGEPIGAVGTQSALEVLEPEADARAKIGVKDQWLKIRTLTGTEGYIAAWFVAQSEPPVSILSARGVNTVGINLDQFHPQGTPDPARLAGMGWVRFGYNVSMGRGSQDLAAAYEVYAPLAERYARAGYKVMFAFTHQTYGEGRDEFWPWPHMTDDKWRRLTEKFTDMVGRIAQQFQPTGTVACWQVWNEQDAPIGAVASVPMSPQNYAHLLGRTIQAIRAQDPRVTVISGGHTGGPGPGSNYARLTIQALRGMMPGVLPDGIAAHPYGRGARAFTRYANFGDLRDELNAYLAVLPDRPLWLTEWGALDKEGDNPADVTQYAAEFVELVNREYPGKVAALIWYAWAMGMHNGYGLVGRDDRPMTHLHDRFLALRGR